jgi:hypothetical protein
MVAKETKKMRTTAPKRAIDIVSIAMNLETKERKRECNLGFVVEAGKCDTGVV